MSESKNPKTLDIPLRKISDYGYKNVHKNQTKRTEYQLTLEYTIKNKADFIRMTEYYSSYEGVDILKSYRSSGGVGGIRLSIDPSSSFFALLKDFLKWMKI